MAPHLVRVWGAYKGHMHTTRARACAHTHTHTRARTHTRTHAHTHILTLARTHTHTHARTHAHIHARTHTRTHARTHARANTHTHTHAEREREREEFIVSKRRDSFAVNLFHPADLVLPAQRLSVHWWNLTNPHRSRFMTVLAQSHYNKTRSALKYCLVSRAMRDFKGRSKSVLVLYRPNTLYEFDAIPCNLDQT